MSDKKTVLVVGLGEVGKPLRAIVSQHHHVVGMDISLPSERIDHVDVMHVCYPFQIRDFAGETIRYIERFRPALTIINSTVGIGTTRKIAERTNVDVVHSPVRGKHARMQDEMHEYTKFIGALDALAARKAAMHFESCGFKTKVLSSPETTELGKLTETTYFGVLIAWAQEIERYCTRVGTDFDEVASLYDEVKFFPPVRYFPGIIGGHCVMPNIDILRETDRSPMLDAIQASNQDKIERDSLKQEEIRGPHRLGAVAGPFASSAIEES
jgi:UDP-N-acetyl-D-mannosaminuronate dehydrogenase